MRRKYYLSFFFLIQLLAIKFISFFPEKVEQLYSNGIYIYISNFLRRILGCFPFSVGDVIYWILIVLFIKWIWNFKKYWNQDWKYNIISIINVLSVFYFFFHIAWAINYYRQPLFEKMNIKKEYSDQDLLSFTNKLIEKTNSIHLLITKNKKLPVQVPYSQREIFDLSSEGYNSITAINSDFYYSNSSVKKSLFSIPLSYMGFGGYLNPFTNEAHVNKKLPMYGFPMVVCHEIAHQIGYASESEANFIGFLAAANNRNLYFKYAAYTTALRYCIRNIELKDKSKLNSIVESINPGIVGNFKESEKFWAKYDTFIDKGFHLFYDLFLKFNQQKDGLEGYSKFLDLLINYSKNNNI